MRAGQQEQHQAFEEEVRNSGTVTVTSEASRSNEVRVRFHRSPDQTSGRLAVLPEEETQPE
jgi:hypothetical protein